MSDRIKYYIIILLLFAYFDIQAQISTGQIVGFNLSNMELKTESTVIDAKISTGIHFGEIFIIPLNDNFALQPAILFSAKGSSYTVDTVDISISPIYIEIPVNANLKFGTDAFGVSFFTGAYFSFGVGGNKIESGGEAKEIIYGSGDNKDLKHFDLGVNFGAGLNIKNFLISAQYELGLTNLSPQTSVYTEMKNRVVGISVTSRFAGK
jgi:hypothetical protein